MSQIEKSSLNQTYKPRFHPILIRSLRQLSQMSQKEKEAEMQIRLVSVNVLPPPLLCINPFAKNPKITSSKRVNLFQNRGSLFKSCRFHPPFFNAILKNANKKCCWKQGYRGLHFTLRKFKQSCKRLSTAEFSHIHFHSHIHV